MILRLWRKFQRKILCLGGGEVLAKKYELNFLGRIPIDPNFGHELDNGRKFSQAFKNSNTAKSIQSIVKLMPVWISACFKKKCRTLHQFYLWCSGIWNSMVRCCLVNVVQFFSTHLNCENLTPASCYSDIFSMFFSFKTSEIHLRC